MARIKNVSASYRSRFMSFCRARIVSRRERKEDNMLIRYATLALVISVLGAPPAWAQKIAEVGPLQMIQSEAGPAMSAFGGWAA